MMTRVDRVPIAGENGLLIDHFDMDNAHLGGSAAAIAIGLRRLGISTAVLSSLGSDGYAAQCLELLKQERVCTDMIVTASDHRTATNLYFVDHAGCRATYYSPTYSALMARELSQYDRFAQEARIGVLSLTGMLPDIEMLKWFRSHDLMIVWVSRGIPSEWTSNAYLEYMHHSDCIVIEQREIAIFKNMLGLATPNDILSEGIQSIICCSGKQGISVIAKKGSGRIAASDAGDDGRSTRGRGCIYDRIALWAHGQYGYALQCAMWGRDEFLCVGSPGANRRASKFGSVFSTVSRKVSRKDR